jgi:hypothetical protein
METPTKTGFSAGRAELNRRSLGYIFSQLIDFLLYVGNELIHTIANMRMGRAIRKCLLSLLEIGQRKLQRLHIVGHCPLPTGAVMNLLHGGAYSISLWRSPRYLGGFGF